MLDFKRYVIDETKIMSNIPSEKDRELNYASFSELKHTWGGFEGKLYTREEALKAIERFASYEENNVRVVDYPTFKVLIRKTDEIFDTEIVTTILNIREA